MIYVDLVMALNFAVDFLLLLGANSLSGYPPGYGRSALAAVLGGIYGGVCLIPGWRFLGAVGWRLVFLAMMALIAFGCDGSAMRRGGLFVLLSMALGGIAVGLDHGGTAELIAAAAGLCVLCALGFRGHKSGQKFLTVELTCRKNKRKLTALLDTGNMLRDPVTGQPVLVVGPEVAWDLLGLTAEQLSHPVSTVQQVMGLRLIPYRAVGQPGGMLLAKKMDQLLIDGKPYDAMVAFAPHKLSNDGYEALAGGVI